MFTLTSPEHLGFQGHRWHSLSILYELSCLRKSSHFYAGKCHDCFHSCSSSDLACFKHCKKICNSDSENLRRSLQHTWEWNWKTFAKVEEKLLFPWLRSLQVKSAYENILQELEKERVRLVASCDKQRISLLQPSQHFFPVWYKKFAIIFGPTFLWNDWSLFQQRDKPATPSVRKQCKVLQVELEQQYQHQLKMHRFITRLHAMCEKYFAHERKWLITKISALVPLEQQKKFNNRVLRFLGYSNCRLFLVVFDVSLKCLQREEWKQFRSQVPKPVRLLIPYWKRCYYRQVHQHMCIVGP